MYPRGRADADDANGALRRLADELQVPFVPVAGALPLNWFYDAVHLNGTGMREWSAQLAAAIAARLDGPLRTVEPATSGVSGR